MPYFSLNLSYEKHVLACRHKFDPVHIYLRGGCIFAVGFYNTRIYITRIPAMTDKKDDETQDKDKYAFISHLFQVRFVHAR